ncbi:MAG: UDP-N-acetylmuramate dehydrogenase [Gemmatimonadales bacterium]
MTARDPRFVAALRKAVRGEVKSEAPLARFSAYRIGGPATLFLPASPDDAATALRKAHRGGVPVFPLGLGSNVLLPDEGLDALVIRMGKGLDAVRDEGDRWWFGAGLPAPLAARRTAKQGWAGLHLMVGVPGTVGGGIIMNAGCHGGQWADVTVAVTVADFSGAVRTIAAREIPFSYRRSGLANVLVLEVEVQLRPGESAELDAEVERLFAWRQQGTPFSQPCCGSVFKNPDLSLRPAGYERPWTAGSLIEAAGLKGTQVGGAEVSQLHANYFVNTGGASAADVRALIGKAGEVVQGRFGVALEPEVKLIEPDGSVKGER